MPLDLDPILLTGVPAVDAQHRELFARVGALLDASRERRGRDEVARLLGFLGDYVVTHFGDEEALMAARGYPGLEAQRADHQAFVKEFSALYQAFRREGPGPLFVIRVGNRVTAWLREHIYKTDRTFAEWLRQQR